MPNDLRSLAAAHRVLAGVSLLAVLLVGLGSVASLVEIINAPSGTLRWAFAAILVTVGLCWLVTVLRAGPAKQASVLGYLSAVLLIAGAGLTGWNTASGTLAVHSATAPAARGTATLDSPQSGAEVGQCLVDIRFHGRPAPGKTFVVAAQNARSGYYFETDLTPSRGDVYAGRVQAGAKALTADEKYTISVFEHDKEQVAYLVGVVTEVEGDATYWPSLHPPPGLTAPLDSIIVHRTRSDPGCDS